MTTSVESNPLWSFRKPKQMAVRSGETHFNTQREDVMNDIGITNIYPTDFTYKPDPTLEIDFGSWEDLPDPKSFAMYLNMTKEGYNVAMFKDFNVAERLKLAWQKDEGGRITLGGKSTGTMVLMWRTGEKADESQKRRFRISDSVQKSPEEQTAELAEKLGPLGAKVKVTFEDDDSE